MVAQAQEANSERSNRALKLTNQGRAKRLQQLFDALWNKGKADNWDSKIMNYIMWIEHEASRELEGLKKDNQ